MSPLTAWSQERQTGSSDLLTWNLARFSVVIARRGNHKKTLHVNKFSSYFVFLEPLPGDTVASEIQLSGMLLNFWRLVWRAIWKRYCSGVFHRHSDQYHQILNMGRKSLPLKNSRWKIEHWLENTRSITQDVDRKKNICIKKGQGLDCILTRFPQTLYLCIPCSRTESCSTLSWIKMPCCLPKIGKCQEICNIFWGWGGSSLVTLIQGYMVQQARGVTENRCQHVWHGSGLGQTLLGQ